MHRRPVPILVLASILAVSACKSDSVTGPESGDNFMSATIGGNSWTATIAFTASYDQGILAFAGSDASQRTLGIGLIPGDGPGVYPVGPNQPTNANYSEGGATSWNADPFAGSGSVTLTSLTETGATGTFSFVLESDAGGPDLVVTDGKFDVTF